MNVNNQKELTLAHNVFNALIKNRHEGWLALYPTNAEFKEILQSMMVEQPAMLTKQKIDEMLSEREAEAPVCYKREYEQLKNDAQVLGIDWNNAVFERLKFETSPANDLHCLYLNGQIFFSSGQQHFMLYGIEALEIHSAYKLQAVKGLAKVSPAKN